MHGDKIVIKFILLKADGKVILVSISAILCNIFHQLF